MCTSTSHPRTRPCRGRGGARGTARRGAGGFGRSEGLRGVPLGLPASQPAHHHRVGGWVLLLINAHDGRRATNQNQNQAQRKKSGRLLCLPSEGQVEVRATRSKNYCAPDQPTAQGKTRVSQVRVVTLSNVAVGGRNPISQPNKRSANEKIGTHSEKSPGKEIAGAERRGERFRHAERNENQMVSERFRSIGLRLTGWAGGELYLLPFVGR